MRGLILECKNKYIIIIDNSGRYVRIKKRSGYIIGMEIIYTENDLYIKKRRKAYISIAAAVVLVVSLGIGSFAIPYGYIDIEINPSIGLETNIYDRVIGVNFKNYNAEEFFKDTRLKYMHIKDAMNKIIDIADSKDVFINYETGMSVAVKSRNANKAINMEMRIENFLVEKMKERDGIGFGVIIGSISKREMDFAKENNIEPILLILYRRIKASNPEITIDDIKKMDRIEIIELMKNGISNDGWDIPPMGQGQKRPGRKAPINK